ncbi:MAG: translocation/assembly module TamB, partial [Candidatus Eremiobacteraeota bacterium]|nr:translocation/assembly module TamB [Candidatus Eremiobacteraeota bacterium]
PLTIARSDGARLSGAFQLQRALSESGFWIEAHDYPYDALGENVRLPGVAVEAPAFSGRLDGRFAGVGPPSHFRLAGVAAATGLRVGGIAIDTASGSVAGAFGSLRLHGVAARGPWGRFVGDGAYLGRRLSLAGSYRGSFAQLATLTGDVRARGPVDGPVALLIDPRRTIVQVRGAATPGATVAGLSLTDLAGTLEVTQGKLHVYGATARVGGGSAAAAGGFERHIGLSLANVAAGGAIALPNVAPGRLWAIGNVSLASGRPRFDGGAAVAQARVRGDEAAANGDVAFSAARLGLHDVEGRIGTTVGAVTGSVSAPGTSHVGFDLALALPAAPLEPLVRGSALARQDVAGTAEARLRLRGTPALYSAAGHIGVPEGTVNGLAFRGLALDLALGPRGIAARNGTVTVGSTRAGFAGSLNGARSSARLSLPSADLSDFNDYFDAGDTLAGRGRIALSFAERGAVVATSADVALHGLRYRRFELGDALARWTSRGRDVALNLGFGGSSGTFRTTGTLLLPPMAAPPAQLLRASAFRGNAQVRALDLGVWLPAVGYAAPVGGRIDADATIAGRLADPTVRSSATLIDGSIGTVPVRRLHLEALSTLHRTTLKQAEVALPSVDLSGSGSFGFGQHDPLALAIHAKSPNIGTVATRLLGTAGTVSGSGEADLRVAGTRGSPVVAGGFDLESATVRGVSIPRTLGQFSLHGRDVVLSGVEVQFARGALELAGSVPFQIAPFGFGPARAPVALQGELRGIDLGDFAPLLPPDSMLAGALQGAVAIEGSAGAPRLAGAVSLMNGSLRTPAETIPLEAIGATVSLAGRTVTLARFEAQAGGGTLVASGAATFPDLDEVGTATTYAAHVSARGLHLNVPAYGSGQIDGTLDLTHAAAGRPRLSGDVALSDATIPFSALLLPSGGNGGRGFLPDVALDLGVDAGRNVRVRSANVDIGATGSVHAGGGLAAPRLRGGFTSTGGTLTYFNTVFRLQDGAVHFAPDQGVIPTLDAVATTHVIDPDPNTVRNAAGSADVTLNLSGPVTNLSIELSSQPAYDREQILGLLLGAPALGASNLFGETAGSPTLYGSNVTTGLNPGVVGSRNSSGELSVAQEAFGFANAQFTRTLLAPFETSLAQAVGLSNFNVNVDYTGNVGLQARKAVGKKLNALFGTSFGYPYRQTFGFEYKPNAYSAAQVTVFQTLGATGLNSLTPTASITNTSKLQAAQPQSGSAGVSFSLQRLFP